MNISIHAQHVTDCRPIDDPVIEVALARDDDPNTWVARMFVDESGEVYSTFWRQIDVDGQEVDIGNEPADEEIKQAASEAARSAWEQELQ